MNRVISGIAMGVALLCVFPAAVVAGEHDHHQMAAPASASMPMSEGVIKKVDNNGALLTIAHGPIENLGMSGMTMAFKVKEPKQAAALKVGDKVRFMADYIGSDIVIVRIEAAK